jgi:hypothetical protein
LEWSYNRGGCWLELQPKTNPLIRPFQPNNTPLISSFQPKTTPLIRYTC